MAEKIYPSSKPSGNPPQPSTTGNPPFPATKAQLYNQSRPVYRPQPRRSRRSFCCSCCLWTSFILILLIILAAVAGGIIYLLYRPHRPSFHVSSLHISQFNLTSSNKLTTTFNFTVTARNPNRKITFYYDPVSVSFDSDGIEVGEGTIPAFVMERKNTTVLKAVVAKNGESVEENSGSKLKSDLKNKKSVALKIRLDTKVKVKIGSLKMKKVPIRVKCDGIKAVVPAGKTATTAETGGAKCKVDLRIKIWKWTV